MVDSKLSRIVVFCSSWGEFGRLSKTKTDVGKSQNFLAEKSFEQIELGEFGQISPLSEKNGKKEFFVKFKFYTIKENMTSNVFHFYIRIFPF